MTWGLVIDWVFVPFVTLTVLGLARAVAPRRRAAGDELLPSRPKRNRLGDVSAVVGILSLWLFIFPPGFIAGGIAALSLGLAASKREVQYVAINKRMADLGIVLGVIAIPWGLLWWWIAIEIIRGRRKRPPHRVGADDRLFLAAVGWPPVHVGRVCWF